MFKNAVLALATMAALLSGVGMVSAYEAHVVNVQATVQNALSVPALLNFGDIAGTPFEIETGSVFPEEWFNQIIIIALSSSFCASNQGRVSHVEGKIYYEEKPDFLWLGDALYLKLVNVPITQVFPADQMTRMDRPVGNPRPVGETPITEPPNNPILAPLPELGGAPGGPHFILNKASLRRTQLVVGLDVPVFEGFYNEETDISPKASGLTTGPTVIILSGDARHNPDGVELGVDLKIQVTSIHTPSEPAICSET